MRQPEASNGVEVARFVERMKLERVAAGLPATIVDGPTLRIIASIVSGHLRQQNDQVAA